jgi:hypothetical protein
MMQQKVKTRIETEFFKVIIQILWFGIADKWYLFKNKSIEDL